VKAHLESALEEHIESHLLGNGWHEGDPSSYSRALGLDTAELLTFLGASQPQKWAKLVALHGGPDLAQSKFERRLADELTARGVIDVLRKGVKDLGEHFDMAYFAPAHDLTPELRGLYDANRLSVTRQVHHSESNPAASVDLVLFVNGIPLATAELKTQTAGQDVHDAIRQYRDERNPADLIFRGRAVVNFAVDQDNVYTTAHGVPAVQPGL
jgi:type I restriction enzyme, R subunit